MKKIILWFFVLIVLSSIASALASFNESHELVQGADDGATNMIGFRINLDVLTDNITIQNLILANGDSTTTCGVFNGTTPFLNIGSNCTVSGNNCKFTHNSVNITNKSINTIIACSGGAHKLNGAAGMPIDSGNITWELGIQKAGASWNSIGTGNAYSIKEVNFTITGTEEPIPSDTVNISVIEPANNTQYNTNSFNFNLTANASNTFTCDFKLDNVTNETTSYSSGTDVFVNFNKTLANGKYNFSITCNDSSTTKNSSIHTIFVDVTDPVISLNIPTDNQIIDGNLSLNVTLTDDNLFSFFWNLTFTNGTIIANDSNTSLTGFTTFNITDTISLGNFSDTMNFTVEVCDGHTKEIINEFNPNLYVSSITTTKTTSFSKLRDRYSFSFVYDSPKTEIEITVPEECIYLPNSEYKGHFVCEQSRKWIDFEGDYDIEVTGSTVIARSTKPLTKWDFNSIGELNCVSESKVIHTTNSTIDFNANVIETSIQTFTLIIDNPGNGLNITGEFFHNNTRYSSTITGTGSQINLSTTLTIPLDWVNNTNLNLTKDFYWNYTINGTSFNTTLQTQTIHRIFVDNCSSIGGATHALNLSFKNVSNDNLLNVNLDIAFTSVYDTNSSAFNNFSFSFTSINKTQFCIYPAFADYFVDSTIEYTFGGDTYNYNLDGFNFSNSTVLIDLFVTDGTTAVTFTVLDQQNNPVEDILIHVMAYDTGTDSYDTVEILRTDYLGVAIGNLILNTQPYKFMLFLNGSIIFESSNTFITSTSRTFRVTLGEDYTINYGVARGIVSSISFNNVTKTFTFTYSDGTGNIHEGCLRVERVTPRRNLLIEETCTVSASSSILITIGENISSRTYLGTGFVKFDDEEVLNSLSVTFDYTWQKYSDNGLFFTFLISTAMVTAGIFSPPIIIVLLLLSFTIATIAQLITFGIPYLMTLLILGGILIFKLTRNK